jgi:hypothetical protein
MAAMGLQSERAISNFALNKIHLEMNFIEGNNIAA